MSVDKSLISVLSSAVETDSQNIALRIHLASLLFSDNQFDLALFHYQQVLNQEPTNIEALDKAAQSAEKSGEIKKAAGYRKLFNALTGQSKPQKSDNNSPPVPKNTSNSNDEWAEILRKDSADGIFRQCRFI
jgi:predicted Zn-dependent protease